MYKHILVATDGSKLSQKAVRAAAKLAAAVGARMTGIYVMPEYMPPIYGEASLYVTQVSPGNFKAAVGKDAKAALAVVGIEADTAGVTSATMKSTNAQPWSAIVNAARAKKCDLIVMASHGRRGLAGLLLGSETTKVLTHSKVPVLVVR
jgi:nucleotide-binding universal stress UspA family protein